MKIAFIGTPYFAADLLEKVWSIQKDLGIEIPLVVTQPDQPVGRKKVMTPSPVKSLALKHEIPVVYDVSAIQQYDIDLVLLFAFGKIIKQSELDMPKFGFWNVHPSILPKYRGASPLTYPILLGEAESGVSLMQMDKDLDHGPVILQQQYVISQTALRTQLEKDIIDVALSLFKDAINQLQADGTVSCQPQAHDLATFTRPLTKEDGYIELNLIKKAQKNESLSFEEQPALIQDYFMKNPGEKKPALPSNAGQVLWNMYRALIGWPGLWTTISVDGMEKRLKITQASFNESIFNIERVQLEGKNEVDFRTFNAAYKFL